MTIETGKTKGILPWRININRAGMADGAVIWGYGYGNGGYYGGSSGASSPGWSRSYWRG